jgi:serine acetyltransferase
MVEPFNAHSSPLGFGGEQAAKPKAHPKIIQRVANKSIGNGIRIFGNMGTKGFN